MHEIGFAESIIASAKLRVGDRAVASLRVRAGVRHALDQPSLEQAIQLVGAGSPFESATLDLVLLPIAIRCRACNAETDTMERLPACPACASVEVEASGGDELILESITYASPDAAVPADLAVGR